MSVMGHVLWEYAGSGSIEGKAGHYSEYPRNCARFRQGIERGYRSENGLCVGMYFHEMVYMMSRQ
jgi:hypothetical protein